MSTEDATFTVKVGVASIVAIVSTEPNKPNICPAVAVILADVAIAPSACCILIADPATLADVLIEPLNASSLVADPDTEAEHEILVSKFNVAVADALTFPAETTVPAIVLILTELADAVALVDIELATSNVTVKLLEILADVLIDATTDLTLFMSQLAVDEVDIDPAKVLILINEHETDAVVLILLATVLILTEPDETEALVFIVAEAPSIISALDVALAEVAILALTVLILTEPDVIDALVATLDATGLILIEPELIDAETETDEATASNNPAVAETVPVTVTLTVPCRTKNPSKASKLPNVANASKLEA